LPEFTFRAQEDSVARTPDIGQPAPDFTLTGVLVTGEEAIRGEYALSKLRGTPVVLAFYPGDNTTVCTKQLCSYTSGLEQFTNF
jgi:thioredoxin-dependent peroxiredoxin